MTTMLKTLHNAFILCGGLLLTATAMAQSMPNVRPVPGSGAAYVYFPGEIEGRVKLSITKEFGNMIQDRYAIYYRPQGKREELICKETEEHCEKLVPSGQGRIRIAGFYDPGKKLPITHAKFSGICSVTGRQCNINLRENTSASQTLRITTGCNGRDYSVIDFGGKNGLALCVGVGISNPNTYLLAAHQHIRTKRAKMVDNKVKPGFESKTDGKANTKIMMQQWEENNRSTGESAAHYCQKLTVSEGQGRLVEWYVPSINELDKALAGWEGTGQNFVIPKDTTGYFSSTQTGTQNVEVIRWNNAKQKSYVNYKDAAATLCMYSMGI